jgi:hypothetical protein
MRRMILGLAFAVLAAGTASADEKVDAILKKAIEATGGTDNLTKYKAGRMSMKGELSVMGMDLEFTGKSAYADPDMYSMDLNFDVMGQKITVTQVVKGEKIKSVVKVGDMSMNTPKEQEDEIKMAMLMQEAEGLLPLMDKKKFTVKAEADEDVMGKKASVLVITPASLKREFKFYFDQKSGLLVKTAHRGMDGDGTKEVLEEAYHSEFKKVNGIQVAMKIVVKHDDKKFLTAELSDVEVLEKIDAKEFTIDD